MRDPGDWRILQQNGWYRIPVSSVNKWLKNKWPPQWIAFYHTRVFGPDKYTIQYYAKVKRIRETTRGKLFPREPENQKTSLRYYKISVEELQKLPRPIVSRRMRRIIFIPTTYERFNLAEEINDLYEGNSLEELIWRELKKHGIPAEREELIRGKSGNYFLDFAIYCHTGKLDVETDGDAWHSTKKRIASDDIRDNELETLGWRVLRFNSKQILDSMEDYCLPAITMNIKKLGGVKE
ncbi:MAG: DUF559 domain-containing protein [Chlorobi bacterium]|nr:DUF559 domain-containing protein [Chlorobiota bacterium]